MVRSIFTKQIELTLIPFRFYLKGQLHTMSLSTIEMARVLEQLEESPEKIMFGKLLQELGSQSEERVRSAARQVPLKYLRELVYQFNSVIEERRSERIEEITQGLLQDGLSADELYQYMTQRKVG